MREIQALLEGQEFASDDDHNAKLAELMRGGRLHEKANAWKRDDPKWRAQELAYDALEASDPVEALRLVHEALKLDPDCTEAQHLMVSLAPMDLDSRIRLMRETVDKAERNMGESFIRENTGHFWRTLSTRPYMRAKRELAELLSAAGRLTDAIAVFEQMLELNPDDNLGTRFPLLGLYLATDQPERVNSLIARFPDEERILGSVAWARVLERWLSGGPDNAEGRGGSRKSPQGQPIRRAVHLRNATAAGGSAAVLPARRGKRRADVRAGTGPSLGAAPRISGVAARAHTWAAFRVECLLALCAKNPPGESNCCKERWTC